MREEPLAELIAHPLVHGLRLFHRKGAGISERGETGETLGEAELAQSLEGFQRIGVELAAVEDAREARALDEIIRQDLVPEIDNFLRFREEAMPADVEEKALVIDRPADAADVDRVLFEDEDAAAGFGELCRRWSVRPGRRRRSRRRRSSKGCSAWVFRGTGKQEEVKAPLRQSCKEGQLHNRSALQAHLFRSHLSTCAFLNGTF